MIVRSLRDRWVGPGKGADVRMKRITKGKKYFVYAIQRRAAGKEYYFIFEDDQHKYLLPEPYAASHFEVVDSGLPSDWVHSSEGRFFKRTNTTFPEWARDFSGFYYRLSEDSQQERAELKRRINEYEGVGGLND